MPNNFDLCLQSWRACFPGYEIIKWDESNLDLDNIFLRKAKNDEMWAFISDYARLKILYDVGGIYLDVDMFMIRPIQDLINNRQVIFGSESFNYINAGIVFSEPRNNFLKFCLDYYSGLNLNINEYGSNTIPRIITKCFREFYNYQGRFDEIVLFEGTVIYPKGYFYNFSYEDKLAGLSFYDFIDKNTYALHLWNASWVETSTKKATNKAKGFLNNILNKCKKWIFP